MSDISDHNTTVQIAGGIIVDIAQENFERAQKLLAGIPAGAKKAIGSALARAGKAGQTHAKKAVSSEYNISQGSFLANTRNVNHFSRSNDGQLTVNFGFKGRVIPLIQFSAGFVNSGHVTVNVKRSTAAAVLERAFIASVNGHTGVWERIGPKRFPIQELYGPSTPQMMYSNETVMDDIEGKVVETFNKRIDHEINRILNGWGG